VKDYQVTCHGIVITDVTLDEAKKQICLLTRSVDLDVTEEKDSEPEV
jgi:hypothetical protein